MLKIPLLTFGKRRPDDMQTHLKNNIKVGSWGGRGGDLDDCSSSNSKYFLKFKKTTYILFTLYTSEYPPVVTLCRLVVKGLLPR